MFDAHCVQNKSHSDILDEKLELPLLSVGLATTIFMITLIQKTLYNHYWYINPFMPTRQGFSYRSEVGARGLCT